MSPTPSLSHPVTPSLLTDLSSPDLSFAAVAARHNLTVDELTLLVMEPDTRARIAATESAGCVRIRLVSTLNLNTVARTLLQVMEDFLTLSKSIESDPARLADIDYIRASDRARKAAWMLYRLSRITPIDEDALARARSVLRGGAALQSGGSSPSPSHSPSPSASPSPRPPVPLCGESSSSSPSPSASSASSVALRVESSSSPAPLPLRPLAPSPSPSSSSSPSPSPPSSASSAALRVEPASSSSSSSSTASLSSSVALRVESSSSPLDSILSNLEQLSASLGIDTSDLDDPDNLPPLPPEFLALFPPELAAYLAPSPTDHAPEKPEESREPAPRGSSP